MVDASCNDLHDRVILWRYRPNKVSFTVKLILIFSCYHSSILTKTHANNTQSYEVQVGSRRLASQPSFDTRSSNISCTSFSF